jgi:hypothetical protein
MTAESKEMEPRGYKRDQGYLRTSELRSDVNFSVILTE